MEQSDREYEVLPPFYRPIKERYWYLREHWWNPGIDGEVQTNALDWDATVPIPVNITII